jgi:hypothetical protein
MKLSRYCIFKYIYLVVIPLLLSGCTTLKLKTVEPWENHYFTVEEFHDKTNDIQLKDNQSIWVISNDTMESILNKTIN